MDTFSALLSLCVGNSPVTGRGALMFSLIRALNKRLSKQSWGCWFETPSRSLWRHCNALRDYLINTGTIKSHCEIGYVYLFLSREGLVLVTRYPVDSFLITSVVSVLLNHKRRDQNKSFPTHVIKTCVHGKCITLSGVAWASQRYKSPITRLFVQQVFSLIRQKTSKLHITGSLREELHHRIQLTIGQ